MRCCASWVESVVREGLCLGCGLCIDCRDGGKATSKLAHTEQGFLVPAQESQSALAGAVEADVRQCCPGLSITRTTRSRLSEAQWGRIECGFIGHAADKTLQFSGASGGALSALLVYVLREQIADYVVHVVADKTAPLDAVICVSRSEKDVAAGSGSRYHPVAALLGIEDIVAREKGTFVYVGKPCDVAGLRAISGRRPLLKSRLVATASFFCAGMPSKLGTLKVLERMGISPSDVELFRYRGNGWPGLTEARTKGGGCHTMPYEEAWGTILNRHLHYRCKLCADGIGELADIVCADAWRVTAEGHPSFDEAEGRSIIMARSKLGETILTGAMSHGYLCSVGGLDRSYLERAQPYQAERRPVAAARLLALALCGRIRPRFRGFLMGFHVLQCGRHRLIENARGVLQRLPGGVKTLRERVVIQLLKRLSW